MLLADADRVAATAQVLGRQAVAEPVAGAGDEFNVAALEPDFLVQFAIKGRFRLLVAQDAALGKLPATPIPPTAQEQFTTVTHQDYADVGAKSLVVDVIAHGLCKIPLRLIFSHWRRSHKNITRPLLGLWPRPRFPNLPPTHGGPLHRLPLIPVFVALGATTVLLLLLSLMLGSVHLEPAAVWHAVWNSEPSLARDVVMDLRLPRALTAFAVGGLLGLAGGLLQVLLRNPLADPYVLGVSGGASVTALLALMAGMSVVMVDAAAGAVEPGLADRRQFLAPLPQSHRLGQGNTPRLQLAHHLDEVGPRLLVGQRWGGVGHAGSFRGTDSRTSTTRVPSKRRAARSSPSSTSWTLVTVVVPSPWSRIA